MSNVQEIKHVALKHELAAGVRDLDEGRFQTYNDDSLMKLADDIGRFGRIRLNGLRLKMVTNVHRRK
jgi:hypothetical protein